MRITGRRGRVGPVACPLIRKTGRRCSLPCLSFAVFLAAPLIAADIPEQLREFADAVQSGNSKAAISLLDPHSKDFSELKRLIEALAALPHTECSIESASPVVEGNQARAETQWTLRLNSQESGPLVVRSEKVAVQMIRAGDEWKIAALSPSSVLARPTTAIFDVIANLASSLSAGNGPAALSAFDSSAANYGQIANDIDALTSQSDVLCAIDVIADSETGGVHKVDTDWYLEIKPQADGAGAQRRRQRVSLQMESKRGKWKIAAMDPFSVVSPVN